MNGAVNHQAINPAPSTNGSTNHAQPVIQDISQIHEALEIVYDPRTADERRRDVTSFLEQAKRDLPLAQVIQWGYRLASDKSLPPSVRHYGLAMLDHAYKYRVGSSEADAEAIRASTVQLAQLLDDSDGALLRNKTAALWGEAAKRDWAVRWRNMDTLLVELWQGSLAHKALVLSILEMLSDDIFNREDATAALRQTELSRDCVDIFVPKSLLTRESVVDDMKCGDEGWLARLCQLLSWCLDNRGEEDSEVYACIGKVLDAIKAAIVWIVPKAIRTTGCLDCLCKALNTAHIQTQLVSVLEFEPCGGHRLITWLGYH
jgi:exportin-5